MDETQQFFVSESIRHAKSLPYTECLRYLGALIDSLQADHPVHAPLATVHVAMLANDQQLELIQMGQLKLDLQPARRRSGAGRSS